MDHRVKHTPLAPSKNESRRDIPTTICAVVAGGLTLAAVCGKKVGLSASARIGAGVLGTGSALVALYTAGEAGTTDWQEIDKYYS